MRNTLGKGGIHRQVKRRREQEERRRKEFPPGNLDRYSLLPLSKRGVVTIPGEWLDSDDGVFIP